MRLRLQQLEPVRLRWLLLLLLLLLMLLLLLLLLLASLLLSVQLLRLLQQLGLLLPVQHFLRLIDTDSGGGLGGLGGRLLIKRGLTLGLLGLELLVLELLGLKLLQLLESKIGLGLGYERLEFVT